MRRHLLIGLILLAAAFSACNKPVDGGSTGPGGVSSPTDCSGVMCTAMFASVGLQVRNAAGAPVALDAFVVTDASGAPLPMNNGQAVYGYPNIGDGTYSVINDNWVQGHQK